MFFTEKTGNSYLILMRGAVLTPPRLFISTEKGVSHLRRTKYIQILLLTAERETELWSCGADVRPAPLLFCALALQGQGHEANRSDGNFLILFYTICKA